MGWDHVIQCTMQKLRMGISVVTVTEIPLLPQWLATTELTPTPRWCTVFLGAVSPKCVLTMHCVCWLYLGTCVFISSVRVREVIEGQCLHMKLPIASSLSVTLRPYLTLWATQVVCTAGHDDMDYAITCHTEIIFLYSVELVDRSHCTALLGYSRFTMAHYVTRLSLWAMAAICNL